MTIIINTVLFQDVGGNRPAAVERLACIRYFVRSLIGQARRGEYCRLQKGRPLGHDGYQRLDGGHEQ